MRKIHPLQSAVLVGYLSIYLAFAIVFAFHYLPYRHAMSPDGLIFGVLIVPVLGTLFYGSVLLGVMMLIFLLLKVSTGLPKKIGISLFSFIIVISIILPPIGDIMCGSITFYSFAFRSVLSRAKGRLHDAGKQVDEYDTKTNRYPISQQEFESLFSSSSTIKDPFNHYGKESIIYIPLSISTQYLIISLGPDGRLNLPVSEITTKSIKGESILDTNAYDPSNGIISNGDIWYLGP